MASSSLRRSRGSEEEEEEDDEDISRASTPTSTAPRDGKRARRNEPQDHAPLALGTADTATDTYLQSEKKPSLSSNGGVVSKKRPRHQPGAIVRVKLTNFVTYTSAEFFPGPNLNMVIGPNGTGKSTLVCAICLGLGWGTQYLGRAKDVAEFVKHGCREATIEIELQRSSRGANHSAVNPVITRTIKREGNKSVYTLNGQTATNKAVLQLARSFDIQIDNLCQFLPQDKVVEFAQMTPIEILESTQRAAAPAFMLEMHENLKELRTAQKDSNDNNKNDRDTLANLQSRQEMQRTEVERMRERFVVQKRLGWLKKCRPIPQYAEAKVKIKEVKARQKELTAQLQQLRKETEPALKKVEAKRLYVKEVQEHKRAREKDMKNAEKECDRLARVIDNHAATMQDCDQIEAAETRSVQPNREEMNRTRVRIATLKRQKEQAPEPFDSRALNEEIQVLVNQARDVETRFGAVRESAETLKEQRDSRLRQRERLKKTLEALNTEVGKQEDLLKARSGDSYRAWEWIKDNRDKFRKPVFGPPMVECMLKDPSMAGSIESVLQANDFRIFTVQCREDFALLQQELIKKQRLHDVSLRVCPFDSLANFKAPLSPEAMRQFGLKGWAIDLLDGPPTVLAMLCQEKFLHQTAMTDTDITQEQHDQLGSNTSVRNYVTKIKSYQFVRRAEFGAAGIQAREKAVRRPDVWTNQPGDPGRKQQLEAEVRQTEGELREISMQLKQLEQDYENLRAERGEKSERVKQLREEKDEKQKALTEYNGLDTKITQAEEKEDRLRQNLESLRTRLTENRQKKDAAMFEKAEAVLRYADAVNQLQEKSRAQLEIEVMYIEAHNDLSVLAERNKSIIEMVKQKSQEEKEATDVASRESTRARELIVQVKKLRDEGIELEQRENDRGLTDILEQLSQNANHTEKDLDVMIEVEQSKLDLTEGGNSNAIKEFEERAKQIERIQSRLTKINSEQQELLRAIQEIREKWEPRLDEVVAKISEAFGESFARIGCAGQVVVHKASSDDPVDCTDELGGSTNGLDFANWAIHISVKFRDNEALSLLDSHRQSGGERAVSTIFYLMALQSLSRAPFRVVDEINQGMDARNERMVHGRMVDMAAADDEGHGQGSQYFLITPKLLSGLTYKTGMTVLCIVSGENMPSAEDIKVRDGHGSWITQPGRKIDFPELARKARALGLNRRVSARKSVNGGFGRSQISEVGA